MTLENKLTKKSFLLSLSIPTFVLFIGLIIIYQFNVFEFDPDEGINLMKAFLLNNDYRLYEDVWNDQPPLLTYILALAFDVHQPDVNLARTIILLFSAILAWENWLILYFFGGRLAAFIGSFLLVIAPNYLRLSVSVMIGLPAIVLAMTAILAIAIWHERKRLFWLIASAIFLSLSILTKLFTLFLAPIIVTGIFIDSWFNSDRQLNFTSWKKNRSVIIWCVTFLGSSLILIGLLVGYENISFLIDNHSDARNLVTFQSLSLDDAVRPNYQVFLFGLSGLGIFFAIRKQQWQAGYFLAWFLTSFYLLQKHRPVWYHHSLLVYLPAIALVGYALQEVILKFIKLCRTYKKTSARTTPIVLSIIVFICSILMIGEHTKTTFKRLGSWQYAGLDYKQNTSLESKFIEEINRKNSVTNWMITDSLMFAFRAGSIVPPSLAVVSRKQLETGQLTAKDLLKAIEQYQPEQIFFKRFEWSEITPAIEQKYDLKKEHDNVKLYWLSNK